MKCFVIKCNKTVLLRALYLADGSSQFRIKHIKNLFCLSFFDMKIFYSIFLQVSRGVGLRLQKI